MLLFDNNHGQPLMDYWRAGVGFGRKSGLGRLPALLYSFGRFILLDAVSF